MKRANIGQGDVFIRTARLRWIGHVVRMPEERIPSYLLHCVPKQRTRGKNWLSSVLEDVALFTGVDNTLEAVEEEASNRVQLRGLIRRNKVFLCGACHSND
jgi:hypothetical protein